MVGDVHHFLHRCKAALLELVWVPITEFLQEPVPHICPLFCFHETLSPYDNVT